MLLLRCNELVERNLHTNMTTLSRRAYPQLPQEHSLGGRLPRLLLVEVRKQAHVWSCGVRKCRGDIFSSNIWRSSLEIGRPTCTCCLSLSPAFRHHALFHALQMARVCTSTRRMPRAAAMHPGRATRATSAPAPMIATTWASVTMAFAAAMRRARAWTAGYSRVQRAARVTGTVRP